MPPRKKSSFDPGPLPPPSATLEGREQQLTALAYDLAEHRLSNNEASAQEVVHFLKLGTVQAQLQNTVLQNQISVLEARVEEMKSRTSQEGLLAEALRAFRGYSGQDQDEDEVDDFYDS